ncbi:MAG TPA: type II toxin-antitoxin system prevent-host-death family antitoxin [Ruminococcaceae bacterium]|nr:type II toxin-antitoxin system prevent-host-death family antitoxin [Oscillospiraceae bacterium]
MSVTTAELQMNLSKYLQLAATEDVFITENGKVIAKISNPNIDKRAIVDSLVGIIPADITLEEARDERLSKI